ncbi:MAG: hypothetical protein KIS76_04105 [Pyrinomonadaceae bacterium]|nr:hypothetical protein [Pyrinomonadaceae bacterium]
MLDRYGPNSLEVSAYVQALDNLTSPQLEKLNLSEYEFSEIESIIKKAHVFKESRSVEQLNVRTDASNAVKGKGHEWQRLLLAEIATWLVLSDYFEIDDRSFIRLYLIGQVVSLRELYQKYENEDWAIEVFCDQISKIDGQRVIISSRPDDKGRGGKSLPDFILNRKGIKYTVEHTSVESFEKQKHYNVLWDKYIKPLEIEKKVSARFPTKWIGIRIPINIFNSENEARKYDFDGFLIKLFSFVEATIQEAPKTYNLGKKYAYQFNNPNFEIFISLGEGFKRCFVFRIAPTTIEQVKTFLSQKISEAIKKKQSKLQTAKERGENTILLLDSDDSAFVNVDILSEAFSSNKTANLSFLRGIDEVYIVHRGGSEIIVPVKLYKRFYPDINEYNEYKYKQLEL